MYQVHSLYCLYSRRLFLVLHTTNKQQKPMTTFNYTVALYRFAYDVVGMSEQDNIRYSYGECLDCNIGIDTFYDNVNRALCAV